TASQRHGRPRRPAGFVTAKHEVQRSHEQFGTIEAGDRPASLLMQGSDIDKRRRRSHCENMKNLTVSLDDETYRRARMIAAERDTSVSALVKRFLVELTSGETEFERLKRMEQEIRAQITA